MQCLRPNLIAALWLIVVAPTIFAAPSSAGIMGSESGVQVDPKSFVRPSSGFAVARVGPTDEKAPASGGEFRTSCTVSHMSFDDPIVYPGQAGQSHSHTFFGNTATDARSTPQSILNSGNSTCRGGIANRSAYWVPTMIDTVTHRAVVPQDIGVYYKNGVFDGALVQPLPEGLRMIAGNPAASSPDDPGGSSHRFKCIGGPNNQNDHYGPDIPNCDVGAALVQEIGFPQCWDGTNFDSPDHKSHMSFTALKAVRRSPGQGGDYAVAVCPRSHPVILPSITFNVIYVVTTKDAPLHWRLASDNYDPKLPGGYSSHGDWFNGWSKEISDAWVKSCIQAMKDCHSHLLGDGRMIF